MPIGRRRTACEGGVGVIDPEDAWEGEGVQRGMLGGVFAQRPVVI